MESREQDIFKVNREAVAVDSLAASATIEVVFHMLLKLLPSEEKDYWYDQKRRALLSRMIDFYSGDPKDVAAQSHLSNWKAELDEIKSRLKVTD